MSIIENVIIFNYLLQLIQLFTFFTTATSFVLKHLEQRHSKKNFTKQIGRTFQAEPLILSTNGIHYVYGLYLGECFTALSFNFVF